MTEDKGTGSTSTRTPDKGSTRPDHSQAAGDREVGTRTNHPAEAPTTPDGPCRASFP